MRSEVRQGVSFALNLVLAATVLALGLNKSGRAPTASAGKVGTGESIVVVQPAKNEHETPARAEQATLPRYAEFVSPSDRRRAIVEQLRAMGAPNDVLALVARVDFETEWESRFKECWGDMEKMSAVQVEMEMSKDAEMRAALGEEGFRQWDQKHMLWEAMSTAVDVTDAEASAIYDLKKKLQARQRELEHAKVNGTMDDAEIDAAHETAFWEYFDRLKGVLGDERFAVSQQLDAAFAADNLRHQLSKVNVTEGQFEELFNAERNWNNSQAELNRRYHNKPPSPEYVRQLKALDAAREREYERVLGSEAYQDLRKKQDPGYAQMKKYESRWDLDEQKIDYVYGTMKDYEKAVEGYRSQVLALQAEGKHVDWEEVNNTLQRHAAQAQQALKTRLGDDTFARLQRNHVLRFMKLQKGNY